MGLTPESKWPAAGRIPREWEVRRLGDCVRFLRHGVNARAELIADGRVRYIHYGDVHTMTGVRLDVQAIPLPCLPAGKAERLDRLQDGDLVFVDASEDIEGVGKSIEIVGAQDREVVAGLHTIAARFDKLVLVDGFKGYLQCCPAFRSHLRQLAAGTKVYASTRAHIASAEVPLPNPSEQRAIATALHDVDAILFALDRLIAKKRDLKQAAMQQLLTGRVRLPGFSREWVVKPLRDIASIHSGGTPSTTEARYWSGGIPWCTPTDITALEGRKYLRSTARAITPEGLAASAAEVMPEFSVVMTTRATIGECAINTVPLATNQGFKNFVPFGDTDVEFLFYLLGRQKQSFIRLCGGSTFLEIGKQQLAAYEVRLPDTKSEQSAIAAVLSDMDAEIEALEARRAKTHDLKQAMMQELLTGRTRLV